MSFGAHSVQLQFIYEGEKYLLKEAVQEMGLKMAAEVSRTDAFYNLGFKIRHVKINQFQQDIVFSLDLYIIMILKICTCIFFKYIPQYISKYIPYMDNNT